jgi:hypothetical protein
LLSHHRTANSLLCPACPIVDRCPILSVSSDSGRKDSHTISIELVPRHSLTRLDTNDDDQVHFSLQTDDHDSSLERLKYSGGGNGQRFRILYCTGVPYF